MNDNEKTGEQVVETAQKTNKSNPFLIIGTIAVIGIVGFIFTQNIGGTNKSKEIAPETANTPQASPIVEETSSESGKTASTATVVAVEAGGFYYKPNEIRVKKGETIKIVMTSKDMMHDFTIDELGVKLSITKAGNTGTVEFTADKTGTFEFYCSVGQHRKNGQVGKLIVE